MNNNPETLTSKKQDFDCQKSLSAENEEYLVNLVREMSGIRVFDHQMAKFRQTVCNSCEQYNYPDCTVYIEDLKRQSFDSTMHEDLIAGVTVGESYFFRDKAQMDYLRNKLLPSLIQKRRDQNSLYLRIWSAGCSDGQELYSIAILLHQLLPDLQDWTLHMLGTDINVNALSRAIKGQYSEWSFRSTDENIRNAFFTKQKGKWHISNVIQKLTKYSYLNLYSDNFPSISSEINAMDLILCRNVFIYFDPATAKVVMEKFYQSLLPSGYLLQSASDLLDFKMLNFKRHYVDSTSFFQKAEYPKESQLSDNSDGLINIFSDEGIVENQDYSFGKLNFNPAEESEQDENNQPDIILNQLTPIADKKKFMLILLNYSQLKCGLKH